MEEPQTGATPLLEEDTAAAELEEDIPEGDTDEPPRPGRSITRILMINVVVAAIPWLVLAAGGSWDTGIAILLLLVFGGPPLGIVSTIIVSRRARHLEREMRPMILSGALLLLAGCALASYKFVEILFTALGGP